MDGKGEKTLEEMELDAFTRKGELDREKYFADGKLNMRLLMESFMRLYGQTYGTLVDAFPEEDGRELFLRYLSSILEGHGSYSIDERTKTESSTDIMITYLGQQYLIALRVWHGNRHLQAGKQQIVEYLERYELRKGYLLSFSFDYVKTTGIQWIKIGDKVICEGTI